MNHAITFFIDPYSRLQDRKVVNTFVLKNAKQYGEISIFLEVDIGITGWAIELSIGS